jgi:hypothetical protein
MKHVLKTNGTKFATNIYSNSKKLEKEGSMKRKNCFLLIIVLFFIAVFFSSVAHSAPTYITTSASGTGVTGDDAFTDYEGYSYTFVITDDDSDDKIFHATLTNTSPDTTTYPARIDLLAFNMSATLDTDFTIQNDIPDWTFTDETNSNSIRFDYIGEDGPGDELYPNETLTFDFVFNNAPTDPFKLWTDTESSLGNAIGGGEDLGQVAVSFQTLGPIGNDSDLLASNWTGPFDGGGGGGGSTIPEPATLLLFGCGLLGLAGVSRKKRFQS